MSFFLGIYSGLRGAISVAIAFPLSLSPIEGKFPLLVLKLDKNFSASNEFMLVYSKKYGTNIRNVVIDPGKKEKFSFALKPISQMLLWLWKA